MTDGQPDHEPPNRLRRWLLRSATVALVAGLLGWVVSLELRAQELERDSDEMSALIAEGDDGKGLTGVKGDLADVTNELDELQGTVTTNGRILGEMVGALTELEFDVTQAQRGGVTYTDLEGLGRELDRVGRCIDKVVSAFRYNASLPVTCL